MLINRYKKFMMVPLMTVLIGGPALAVPEPQGPPSDAEAGWKATTVVEGIEHPWGIAWLADGKALITARPGSLHLLEDGSLEEIPMEGLPEVFAENQGGLLDIALHPADREKDRIRVYMTLSTGSAQANRTILVRGNYEDKRLTGIETLFQVEPDKSEAQHFGSRLLWLPDGTLLMSVGDGGNPPLRIGDRLAREQAQNRGSHLGGVLRLTEDGKPAPGNPFLNQDGVKPELWTYGNRNIQGLALDPKSGKVWANEHGPKGGDELQLLASGKNYGWPEHTLGVDYRTGEEIGGKFEDIGDEIEPPKAIWVPAHAPSGLTFYTGDRFPAWTGSLFSGGLVSEDIRRIVLEGDEVKSQERLNIGRRIRDVKQGPDGHLYALTDEENGRLLRIEPED